jgi:hypothetical protein
MAFTIEEVQPVINSLSQTGYGKRMLADLPQMVDYLTGKTTTMPAVVLNWHNATLLDLCQLLTTPDAWGSKDQKVLDILTSAPVWPVIKGSFVNTVSEQIEKSASQAAWDAFIVFLKKHFSLPEIFQLVLNASRGSYDLRKDGSVKPSSFQITWLKEYLKQADANTLAAVIRANVKNTYTDDFLGLLIDAVPAEVEPYLNVNLMSGIMIQTGLILPALSYSKEKYIKYILDKIRENLAHKDRDTVVNRFTALAILHEKQPGVADELLIQTAKDYLEVYTTVEYYGWEHHYTYISTGKQYPFSALAANILLKREPAEAKERLWKVVNKTRYLPLTTLQVITGNLQQDAISFLLKSLQADVSMAGVEYHELILQLLGQFDKEKYSEQLWDLMQHKSKQVRELMSLVLSQQENAVEKSAAFLNHRNAETRQTAAAILSLIPSPEAKALLEKAVASEKNDDTRDLMLQTVSEDLYNEVTDDMLQQLVDDAANRGKLGKPLEEWLNEESLPSLYYKNGKQLHSNAVRFLLYRMSRVKTMRSDVEARLIIDHIDKEKSADFALHLIKLFIDKGTKPEHKYLLAIAALLGNDTVVDKIRITINKWIEDSRFKMAEYGVGALALQGSNKALRWVEWYSRKYRTKKANVGAAALVALEAAAEELNITPYELGDRIVPDFGFDGLFKHFEAAGENYRAFIDSNFKMAFFNDDNKKLKSLPAAADNELKEEFKAIAKEVRDVVKSQSSRLEYYVVIQRRWTVEQWQQFFLNNPVMFIYATKLLWGIYENNELKQCFYCQEDTTLMDEEDNEISLSEEASIGIVHPLQLSAEALQVWQRKFFELAIEPEFPQLNRPVYRLAPEDKHITIIRKFEDVKTEPGSIKGALDKSGWNKPIAADAGFIDSFSRDDYSGNIKAVLEVEGVHVVGFDNDMDPKLGRLYFLHTTKENKRWFSPPKDDKDERLVPLGNLPEVFYSEVMAGVNTIKIKKADDAE